MDWGLLARSAAGQPVLMTPTPEWFFGVMMAQVVPVVVVFMVAGAVLGLLVKGLRTGARRVVEGGRRRRY